MYFLTFPKDKGLTSQSWQIVSVAFCDICFLFSSAASSAGSLLSGRLGWADITETGIDTHAMKARAFFFVYHT